MTSGARIGPYELLDAIGAGGMGEVWKARDTRLNRTVAIKFSREQFSERFEREARAVAALNHPNICTLHDVGPNYLVMEFVEGPTLAGRIAEGAMPLEEALAVARQLTDALEAAHEKGIVHRDLKPANIKIKPGGVVKVLDFGLAKMSEQAAAPGSPESSPTMTMEATRAGQAMGTAAYMAPEQARGQTVDKRADIWAFGVVLYEMLAGRRLFQGDSIQDTLVAVLKQEPEWNRVPGQVRRLLQSCLEKDPKRRLRDIADVWRLIEEPSQTGSVKRGLPWPVAGALAVALILAVGLAVWLAMRPSRPLDQPVVRLDIDLGVEVTFGPGAGPAAILSPDGERLVFVAQGSDGTDRLFIRRLDQPKAAALANTEGAFAPFFSPDGRWVGFFAAGKLKKVALEGHDAITLCDAPNGRGASWGEDGTIIATLDSRGGLSQVPSEGGKSTLVTELGAGEITHRWPHVLPGGKSVLFNVNTVPGNYEEAGIAVVSLGQRRKKIVLEHAGMNPRYLPSGHLVYVRNATLFAVPFDLARLEVRGGAKPVLEEVLSDSTYGFAQLDYSRSGAMVYRRGRSQGLRTIQWLNSAGQTEPLWAVPALYQTPHVSPDGSSRIAAVLTEGYNASLWVYDWQRGIPSRLTTGPGVNAFPLWSPDGRYLVFESAGGMFWTRADGAEKPQPLTRSQVSQFPSSFSADGTRLAFSELRPGGGSLIWTVPVEGGSGQPRAGKPELFLQIQGASSHAAFSPDGRWLAYATTENGIYEVYVRAFPDRGTKRQISNNGGVLPKWSKNGKELFYRTLDQRIMVANYMVHGETFVADKPRVWSQRQIANTGVTQNLDLAPDGKRFAVLMPVENPELPEARNHVTLALHFFDEVRRRMAGGK